MFEFDLDNVQYANIIVIGCGGAGSNAVNRMIAADLTGIQFVALNTDAQALHMSDAHLKIQVGEKLTKGLGGPAPIPASGSVQRKNRAMKFEQHCKERIWSLLPPAWVGGHRYRGGRTSGGGDCQGAPGPYGRGL